MNQLTVCVATGSRADYGNLREVMRELRDSPDFVLQVLATGMHLAPEFGSTVTVIEDDGFTVDARVDMLVPGDSPSAITKSVGRGIVGAADALADLAPDWLLVLGDRFEILALVQAAMFAGIPIVHIGGGDVTEGAVDESIRHAITKMAHLHFTSNEAASARIRQMGENPDHVITAGAPALDLVRVLPRLSREELSADLGYTFQKENLLVTFHPETVSEFSPEAQVEILLEALAELPSETGIIFTGTNADAGGRIIFERLKDFVQKRPGTVMTASLGQTRYFSLLATVTMVVGNSSSGLYEAPSFRVPTVNIGDRQKGRLRASSVMDCALEKGVILRAISQARELDCSGTVNPFGDGHSAPRIVEGMRKFPEPRTLLRKHFITVPVS